MIMINTRYIQENFPKGKLSVVLGRPGAGKTSMAVSLAQVLASEGNHPIFFSMEMNKEMLATRFAAHMGSEDPIGVWANTIVNDTPSLKVGHIRKVIDGINVDSIIIDYLELMTCEGCSSREEELEQIKSELKAIASERDIPIILLSQMNRSQYEKLNQELVVITE